MSRLGRRSASLGGWGISWLCRPCFDESGFSDFALLDGTPTGRLFLRCLTGGWRSATAAAPTRLLGKGSEARDDFFAAGLDRLVYHLYKRGTLRQTLKYCEPKAPSEETVRVFRRRLPVDLLLNTVTFLSGPASRSSDNELDQNAGVHRKTQSARHGPRKERLPRCLLRCTVRGAQTRGGVRVSRFHRYWLLSGCPLLIADISDCGLEPTDNSATDVVMVNGGRRPLHQQEQGLHSAEFFWFSYLSVGFPCGVLLDKETK